MSVRLNALCGLIERCDSFIDVGCDHGYAVEYVCRNGLADKITACDISQPSLNKAKALLADFNEVNYVCADGAVAAKGYGTVLVSGMGGLEIMRVIEGCEPKVFILSPQSHARDVRSSLMNKDYFIERDFVVCDGRYYDVMLARRGGGIQQLKQITEVMLAYGIYISEYNQHLKDKLLRLLGAVSAYPDTEENTQKLKLIKEALRWQSR